MQKDIEILINNYAKELAIDLNKSMNDSLRQAGNKNVQDASLHFNPVVSFNDGSIRVQILASDAYWYFIEHGRKKGSKAPPSKALGKKWQNLNNIDPRKVLYDIELKYYQKKSIKRKPKTLKFDEASKTLSFLLARSIAKKGIKPKPFIDRVKDNGKTTQLIDSLSTLLGKQIAIEITNGSNK